MKENPSKIDCYEQSKKVIRNRKSPRKKSKDHRRCGQSFSPKKDLFFGKGDKKFR